jgi:hypothetical protein
MITKEGRGRLQTIPPVELRARAKSARDESKARWKLGDTKRRRRDLAVLADPLIISQSRSGIKPNRRTLIFKKTKMSFIYGIYPQAITLWLFLRNFEILQLQFYSNFNLSNHLAAQLNRRLYSEIAYFRGVYPVMLTPRGTILKIQG